MNRDLFLSILALDSYNRGYGERLLIKGNQTALGNATVGEDALSLLDPIITENADFYAISYEWGGETIISYRGTDGLNDILTGWTTGAGWTDQAQANLAIKFYNAATQGDVFASSVPANVTLTGHSLGGGLAGFVSMLSGADALLFDHMPFGRAAADTACALPLNDNQPTSWSIAA